MIDLEKKILEDRKAKCRFITENGLYPCFHCNIFSKMSEDHFQQFANGDGNELYSHAMSVRSSSMLAYNFFHWIDETHPITLNIGGEDHTFNKVKFEQKFQCTSQGKKANLDVVLINDKGIMLCIECKFMEHLENGSDNFGKSYFQPSRTAQIDWSQLVNKYSNPKNFWYQGGLKQNISHLVALNRFAKDKMASQGINRVIFINVIFQPKENRFNTDFDNDKKYRTELKNFQDEVEKMTGLAVKLDGILTYLDIYKALIESNAPEELKEFLIRRYMKYHEGFERDKG